MKYLSNYHTNGHRAVWRLPDGGRLETTKPAEEAGLGRSSGGRTRTDDPRIMIPLL